MQKFYSIRERGERVIWRDREGERKFLQEREDKLEESRVREKVNIK